MKVEIDSQQFLEWVSNEHGAETRRAVEALMNRRHAADPAPLLREALIELHPRDFRHDPASDQLPYGFCSD